MEHATLQRQLLQAESLVAVDARRVSEQRKRVINMESAGHDASLVREQLAYAEELHARHVGEVERLRDKLGEALGQSVPLGTRAAGGAGSAQAHS